MNVWSLIVLGFPKEMVFAILRSRHLQQGAVAGLLSGVPGISDMPELGELRPCRERKEVNSEGEN